VAGTYSSTKTVVVESVSTSATVYYTIDAPIRRNRRHDPVVEEIVEIQQTGTLKARAFDPVLAPSNIAEAFYELKMPTPQLSPGGGLKTSAVNVVATLPDPELSNYEIRYTLDGSDPDENSDLYSTPIHVATETTIKARAFKAGWSPSGVESQIYTMNFERFYGR
jgi:hypothetical protein